MRLALMCSHIIKKYYVEIRHGCWVSSLPCIFDVAEVMKEGRRKQTGMVQGLFRCCLQKRSSLFLEYLSFFYKPHQEQNTVKPLAVLIMWCKDRMAWAEEERIYCAHFLENPWRAPSQICWPLVANSFFRVGWIAGWEEREDSDLVGKAKGRTHQQHDLPGFPQQR